jgi:putative membrane protein
MSVSVFAVAELLPGVKVKSFGTAIVVAMVYGIIHFLLYRVLQILTLPLVLITLGLFNFILNAFLLWVTDKFLDDFEIKGFGLTIIASLLITIMFAVLRFATSIVL